MTARDHNRLLGIFFLINGGLSAFGGILAAFIYGGVGTMLLTSARKSEDQFVGGLFLGISLMVALVIVVFAGFYLLTGWKIYKEKQIGRTLGIVASCLSLLSMPLGTALGVYGLWFFFGNEGKAFYDGGEVAVNKPAPPPNSWQ